MDHKALVKRLRLDLLRGEDRANWFHQIYEATEAIESLIADCVRKDEALARANKQAQKREDRCKMLEAELVRVKRELDAAITDMQWLQDDTGEGCDYCAHYGDCKEDECLGWAWRGPQEEG